MFLTVTIILNIIFILIGLHYKKYNDAHKEEYDDYLYNKYWKLEYDNPGRYYRKILSIAKRIAYGKTIEPYEKKLIKKYIKKYLHEEIEKGNNVEAYQSMLELDDDELISSFYGKETTRVNNNSKYKNNNKRKYTQDKEDYGNMMFYSDYNYDNTKSKSKYHYNNIAEKTSKYCECLTNMNFDFDPAIGRENELEELMIAILTPGKSALLLGKARCWKNFYY